MFLSVSLSVCVCVCVCVFVQDRHSEVQNSGVESSRRKPKFLGRRILVYLKGFWYTHVLVGLEEIAEFGALPVERMSGPRGSSPVDLDRFP